MWSLTCHLELNQPLNNTAASHRQALGRVGPHSHTSNKWGPKRAGAEMLPKKSVFMGFLWHFVFSKGEEKSRYCDSCHSDLHKNLHNQENEENNKNLLKIEQIWGAAHS